MKLTHISPRFSGITILPAPVYKRFREFANRFEAGEKPQGFSDLSRQFLAEATGNDRFYKQPVNHDYRVLPLPRGEGVILTDLHSANWPIYLAESKERQPDIKDTLRADCFVLQTNDRIHRAPDSFKFSL